MELTRLLVDYGAIGILALVLYAIIRQQYKSLLSLLAPLLRNSDKIERRDIVTDRECRARTETVNAKIDGLRQDIKRVELLIKQNGNAHVN